MKEVYIPVSFGEIADKISVLIVKSMKINDLNALKHVLYEKRELEKICFDNNIDFGEYLGQLIEVNEELWNILQAQRDQIGKDGFVELSIAVFKKNDERFAIKSRINEEFGSGIVEEKHYE
jgi:hypothetical protein